MKWLILVIALFTLSGCVSDKAKTAAKRADILSAAFKKNMEAGKTTPAENVQHIESMDAEIQAIDSALNGVEDAAATRKLVAP